MRDYPLARGLDWEYLLEGQRRHSLTVQEGRPHAREAALLRERSCFTRPPEYEALKRLLVRGA